VLRSPGLTAAITSKNFLPQGPRPRSWSHRSGEPW
jgi:hypothetical protein